MSSLLFPGKGKVSLPLEPTRIKIVSLTNRSVRVATADNHAERGCATESRIGFYEKLAEGGIGLLISGMMSIHRSGRMHVSQNSFASDDVFSSYRKLTGVVDRQKPVSVKVVSADVTEGVTRPKLKNGEVE
jgi:2,4-dienoyl-CoA reductase-like NADH-dependent reductase (Old Yellow Enzyme family)